MSGWLPKRGDHGSRSLDSVGDQDRRGPPPSDPDGTRTPAGRTGNNPNRGGWEIEMDTAPGSSEVGLLRARNAQLEEELAGLRYELGLGKYEDHPHVTTGRGGWINTYTGRKVYPLDLRVEDIDVRDIAHALALECRYANHTGVHYSVAQHSVQLSYWVPSEFALDALFHDAEEAYLGDVPRPLKVLPQFAFWRECGRRAAGVIQKRFGLGPEPEIVKNLDHAMCGVEAPRFMNTHPDWVFQEAPTNWYIANAWTWEEAEQQFLARYTALTGEVA